VNIEPLAKIAQSVIPANPGSGPGQAPESSNFKNFKTPWTPVFTGVTTFYEIIKLDGFVKSLESCHCEKRSDEAIS